MEMGYDALGEAFVRCLYFYPRSLYCLSNAWLQYAAGHLNVHNCTGVSGRRRDIGRGGCYRRASFPGAPWRCGLRIIFVLRMGARRPALVLVSCP